MVKTAGNFMKAGVVYAAIGFTLGVIMGASHDFMFQSVHTHLNLVGWATMGIYALFYQLVPSAGETAMARVHFWLANAGLVVMSASIALIAAGLDSAAPGAAVGSLLTLASILLFVYIVFTKA